MKFLRRFFSRFRISSDEAQMAEEMRLHLEERTFEFIESGLSPDEARRAAQRQFGGVEQVKERCREQRDGLWLEHLRRLPADLRHGYASLRRSPTLTLTIIGTLGVALAACVLVFSFLDTFVLKPLPFGDASRLVAVAEHSVKGGRANAIGLTYDNLRAVEERTHAFSRLAIFQTDSTTLGEAEAVESAVVLRVNADAFSLLGARAALGSVITPANAESGGVRAVVLSDALWRRRFGADPAIVGRNIKIGDRPHCVVGVMPPDFVLPGQAEAQAWPAMLRSDYRATAATPLRHHLRHLVWGELAPGASLGTADAQLAAVAASLRQEFPQENADRNFFAISLRDSLLGGFDRQLLLLQGAVLLVLLVACFNCLCLLIARALQRRREFALRLALGAARRHLFAQLLAESLWLSLPAAALALGLAQAALPAGFALIPAAVQVRLNPLGAPEINGTVAAVVVGLAIVIATAFSALPLLQTRRINLETALREGGRSSGSRTARRAAQLLAVGQIAVALSLLISAALLLRTQRALQHLDVGLPTAELDLVHVGLRGNKYTTSPATRLRLFERYREQLLALPGVRAVGVSSYLFAEPPGGYAGFVQEGDGLELTDTPKQARLTSVLPPLFSAIDLRLIEGRLLSDTDVAGHPAVTVVSASLAAKYWPGQSPIGKRVRLQSLRGGWAEVVGIVADLYASGNQPRVVDTFYMPIAQSEPPGLGMGFFIRYGGAPPASGVLQRALEQLDPTLQIAAHLAPAAIFERDAWQSRFVTKLVALFALLAVALALAGIYAVNSFFVARRTNEFGIRVALGATRSDLFQSVLGDSLRLTALGLGVGALLALAATRGLERLLYAVAPVDLPVYTGAALLMTLACLAATILPARRAARVDPIRALRAE